MSSKQSLSDQDSGSLSSVASQATLTDVTKIQSRQHESAPISPTSVLTSSSIHSALPFRPSLWRTNAHTNLSDIENHYFMEHTSSAAASSYYTTELTRGNSIATAISMRQADIIVSRDNPQHLHHHSRSNSRNSNLHDLTVEQALSPGHRYSTHTILKKDDALLYEKKKSVVILLGRLLLKCGCPCHRVDSILQHTAKVLVLDASFAFLPDSVLITFTESDNSQSIMVKAPQGYDNGKIIKINETMNLFFQDKIDLDRCLVLLHDIATAPPTCGIFGTLLFFAASSFSASVMLFKGTWIDGAISGSLGLLVAILYLFSIYYPTYALVFEMSTSIIVALIAKALHQYCCFVSVAMSSLLILLPGYTMTVGVIELTARHVTPGIVRLVYAIFYAFQLAYGLQIGSNAYQAINPNASEEGLCTESPVSPWFFILLLPVLSISLSLSYGSSRKQWIPQMISCTIAFCLSYFLGKIIPDGQIVNAIAAFAIGLYANFALKLTGEPPLTSLCVGVTLLVPGSLGVRGAYAALNHNGLVQGSFPMQMLTITLGLSAGLFAAGMIVYPSGKKHSMYISL